MANAYVSDLSDVIKPVNLARGLPNAHYIDEAVFQEERQSVLFANWLGVGFAHDVPNVGDALPVDFLGMPLLLVRDDKGAVKVYQNTCRHRGMILVKEKSNIRGTIRCPYHSWCYGLDGALRSTPHVGGPGQNIHKDIKRDELGLFEIRSHIYLGVVFVNVGGQADDFTVAHSELLERWNAFDKPLYHHADGAFGFDVNSNWKLAVENYSESYHLPWVHPGLNTVSRLEDHYHLEEPGKYSGQGSVVYQQLIGEAGQTFPDFDGLGEMWDTASEYATLYPNVLFGVHRDHAFAIILDPVGVDKTRERIALFYAQEEAVGDAYKELRSTNAAFWKEVFGEDIFVVEGMQKGRHGVFFDGGKFSPVMDGPTHIFHEWVALQINAGRAKTG